MIDWIKFHKSSEKYNKKDNFFPNSIVFLQDLLLGKDSKDKNYKI
jgi:hypothetical protein